MLPFFENIDLMHYWTDAGLGCVTDASTIALLLNAALMNHCSATTATNCCIKMTRTPVLCQNVKYCNDWSIWATFKCIISVWYIGALVQYKTNVIWQSQCQKLSFLALPDIETLHQLVMVGMVAPTWPYLAISEFCYFGDVSNVITDWDKH